VGVLGVNHIAFRTREQERLREFYAELLDAEALDGAHGALRAGDALRVFFETESEPVVGRDPDELAFDVDAAGFVEVLARAQRMDCLVRPPVEHTPWSKGFLVRDPDGRRIELVHDDHSVFGRE
jgi:catechol 2,3-dioxygenase-like lactoylglutathione lyase family enzyme